MRIVAADRAFPTLMLSPIRSSSRPFGKPVLLGNHDSRAETLAVRGERFAAVAVQIDYGNGMLRESIHVIGLDATLSLRATPG